MAGGSIASAAIAVHVYAIEGQSNPITVFDSRFVLSRKFAATRPGKSIDVAQNPVRLWSALRDLTPKASIAGCTRWSDFVAIRGQLESVGLRVRHFQLKGELIDWLMR